VVASVGAQQVRRPDFSVFELFNAAWCVWSVDPPTKGNTTAAPLLVAPWSASFGPRQSSTAFEVEVLSRLGLLCVACPLPSPRLGLAFWLPPSRMLAAGWRPCESLWGRGLEFRFPVGLQGCLLKQPATSRGDQQIDIPGCANWL
jgi:hypothetical protein